MAAVKKTDKAADSGRSFMDLIRDIPVVVFDRMVQRAGLPPAHARELCKAFRSLKG